MQKLKGAFLTLTNRCNLKCKYCYQKSSPLVNIDNELTKREWFKAIDELYENGAKKISIVGGEPFISKNFWEVLEYLHGKKMKIKVFTNGHFISKKNIQKLQKLCVSFSFNLNSSNSKIQEFYQEKGSWEKTIQAIKLCRDKVGFEIASPITKRNYFDLDNLINLCRNLGAKRIRFVPLIMNNNSSFSEDKITKKQTSVLIEKFDKIKNIEITLGCRTCEGGKYFVTIQPNGDITPCTINKKVLGNLKENSISKILNGNKSKILKSCRG